LADCHTRGLHLPLLPIEDGGLEPPQRRHRPRRLAPAEPSAWPRSLGSRGARSSTSCGKRAARIRAGVWEQQQLGKRAPAAAGRGAPPAPGPELFNCMALGKIDQTTTPLKSCFAPL